jgi:hypothetical protein
MEDLGRISIRINPPTDDVSSEWRSIYSRFSSVKKQSSFYAELSNVRELLKTNDWEDIYTSLEKKVDGKFARSLSRLREIFPKLGLEIQARLVVVMLGLSGQDSDQTIH